MATSDPGLIALDWGTSSLRAYLMREGGAVLDSRSAPLGIMHVRDGHFAAAFEQVTGDWRRRWPELRAVAAGMIGSAQGWREAPYLETPLEPEALAGALVPVPGTDLQLIPGVTHPGTVPDMMRGEETQVAGALALRPELREGASFVLPGTHSKWVDVAEGRIRRFRTFMTGELFGVLRQHSILGRFAREQAGAGERHDAREAAETAVPPDGRSDPPNASPSAAEDAFERGVMALRDGGPSAAPLLFSARALVLAGRLQPERSLDYLSGLLIGEELCCGLKNGHDRIALAGDAALCERYRRAMAVFGMTEIAVLGDTAPAGLWYVAERAGLTGMFR